MYTWLCRVLIPVFAFQIVSPQVLQAQDTYRVVKQGVSAGKDQEYMNKVRELNREFEDWRALWIRDGEFDLTNPEDQESFYFLEEPQLQRLRMLKILWFDRIFFDGRHAELWENYYNPQLRYRSNGAIGEKSVCKLYRTIKNLHTESAWIDNIEKQIRKKEDQQALERAYYAERDGQVGAFRDYQSSRLNGAIESLSASNAVKQRFIQSVENGSMSLEDMIEYIDPWHPADADPQRIITAAEILGNTLDAWAAEPQEIESEESDGEDVWNQEIFNQAVDELLLKAQLRVIHRLSQSQLLSYKSDTASIAVGGTLHILLLKIRNFYDSQNRPNPLESKYYSCGFNNSVTGPSGPNVFSNLFDRQLKSFIRSSYKGDSAEYQQFLRLLDYAVAYEITRDFMGNIENWVKYLNEPLKKNKFEQRLSPALEYLFLSWYENVRYNNNKSTVGISELFLMFSQFTDEENYALPTRIFALEILSNMTYNQNRNQIRQYMQEQETQDGFRQTFYNYTVSDEWRTYWAEQVADIYCPLVSTNKYKMEDYGLDSSQMQLLANKLGSIYSGFVRPGGGSMEGAQLWSGTYEANQCTVLVTGNPINMTKKKKEIDNAILTFIGEAIFWVYGGEIFALVGTAFRVTRGAMVALPRAVRASVMANRGRRGMAFVVEVQKGARMANLSQTLTRNGVRVSATRSTAERGAGSATATETVNLTSNRALGNQYSIWNPRRWAGQRPGQVHQYQVIQQTPGFGLNTGFVNGARLPNGIRSYQDWRIFRSNLFDAAGQRMTLNTYSFAEQNLLRSEAMVLRSVEQMGKDGAFDLWIPTSDGTYTSFRGIPSKESAKSLFGQYLANPTEELLLAPAMPAGPGTLNSLSGMTGVRVSVPELVSGTWKHKVAGELYTPLDWGGTVSNLVMPRFVPKHMSLWSAPGRMLTGTFNSSSFTFGLKNTTKFFLGMDLLDRAVYPGFNRWMISISRDEQEKLMQPYAPIFDPQLLQEDAQAQEEVMASLREQGFNTAPVSPLYEDILAAANPEHGGSLLSFPILAGWQGLSKTFVGRVLGIKSPFESESNRIAVEWQARRLERERMVRRYQNAKMQKDFDAFYNNVLTALENLKTSFLQEIAQMSQIPGAGNLSAERQKIVSYFDSVERSAEQIAKGDGNVTQKCKEINSLWASVEAKVPEFEDELLQKSFAPEGEEVFFRKLIDSYEEQGENFVRNLDAEGYNDSARKADKIFRKALKKLRKAQNKKGGFSVRYQEVLDVDQETFRKLEELRQSLPQSASSAQGTPTVEQLRDEAFRSIDAWEANAGEQGLQADTFFQQWREKVTALCNDSTYTPETLQRMLQLLSSQKRNELDALKAAKAQPSSNATAPAAETGAFSSEELDELLPDATSEIFTGA